MRGLLRYRSSRTTPTLGLLLVILLVAAEVIHVQGRVHQGVKMLKVNGRRGRGRRNRNAEEDEDTPNAKSENDKAGSFVADYVKKIDCNTTRIKELYRAARRARIKVPNGVVKSVFKTCLTERAKAEAAKNNTKEKEEKEQRFDEPLVVLLAPYAPHISEELWSMLGHDTSIAHVPYPKFDERYLVESTKEYPISFNGKMRFTIPLSLDLSREEIEAAVLTHDNTVRQQDGRKPRKVIVVPGKIVNIVV